MLCCCGREIFGWNIGERLELGTSAYPQREIFMWKFLGRNIERASILVIVAHILSRLNINHHGLQFEIYHNIASYIYIFYRLHNFHCLMSNNT